MNFEELGIKVGISGRHIHLDSEKMETLFGTTDLEIMKSLVQPGEFASASTVDIKVKDKVIPNIRVLGPLRSSHQLELSASDCRKLKVSAPVANSAQQVTNDFEYEIIGPKGTVVVNTNCIIARAHIHLDLVTAERIGFSHGQLVAVRIENQNRQGIIENAICRVNEKYLPEFHIDTDEASAFMESGVASNFTFVK
ncbi:PduL/EutD family phosphate acyltransferase [Mollicutes bacterium LVI A0039]|nr:PduL/EutD family phosphate acyltransferase [Mollicutes bacterium LVI A0039]